MCKWERHYLVLATTFYIVSSKSYHTASVASNEAKQAELEGFVQAYLDNSNNNEDGQTGNRDNVFEEVLQKLREAESKRKDRERKEQQTSPPVTATSAVPASMGADNSPEGGRAWQGGAEGSSPDGGESNNALPGLMNYDSVMTEPGKGGGSAVSGNEQQHPPPPKAPPLELGITTTLPPPIEDVNVTPTSIRTLKQPEESPEMIDGESLRILFHASGRGNSVRIPGCDLAHFHVKSRCVDNLLELTLLSRNPVRGQVRIMDGDGEVSMDGTNMVVYAIQRPLTTSGNLWKLTNQVQKDELRKDCLLCDNMNVRVILEIGEDTCGMVVSCQQGTASTPRISSQKTSTTTTPPPTTTSAKPNPTEPPIQDPGKTAKTTMTLTYSQSNPAMAGMAVIGQVALGTRMSLVLSVFSRDVNLDLHVIRCQAKGDDGRGVLLIKDGCSVSKVINEFKEVLSIGHESSFGNYTVRRVSQFAEIRAFNFRRTSHNITLICTIKMCGGECTERPPCVISEINQSRSTRPPVPIFTQEVTLGKVFFAGAMPHDPTPEIASLVLDAEPKTTTIPMMKYPDDCIHRNTVFILMGFLCCVFLGVLLLGIYCCRQSAAKAGRKHYLEDYESPPKALFSEYNSPRRRPTPQKASPEHTTYSINTEEYRSPGYQRHRE